MRSQKEIQKKYTPKEIAASIVFSGSENQAERDEVLKAFRKFRKKITEEQTEIEKLISQLLQLKYQLEDYLASVSFNREYNFGYFLKEYIERQEKKKKEFAEEINVDPTELSQVINKHRKPTEKLIYRLDIHSNRSFPALLWFKLLEKDRAYELSQNSDIIDNEEKFVTKRLKIAI
ncbi:helix-turn-helix domain-containing protein [Chitinophaga sp. SYP-B3965]|uniref:helix-turn-helix domain-containing protein n=1 Tax=Chitinophaga sp. SYP-B3965 TaxID=2663120 RepID=UPI001299674C|nr:helix-turn-helix domain-containing protein [Chitinophaga sp. SYP-B3965]MRG46799.1 helix-turn-helix domain-containing protein [Chitinophaga sp. SYP-B3965]